MSEVAVLLNVSRQRVDQLVRRGALRVKWLGGRRFVHRANFERFVAYRREVARLSRTPFRAPVR